MRVIRTIQELRAEILPRKLQGESVALVPTMGCLHEGHCSLLRIGRARGQLLVISSFVNPLQFGPHEDYDRYPRAFEEDCRKAEAEGVDIFYYPSVQEMYPEGFCTEVKVLELSEKLCGRTRKVHFAGVTTVVLKLFHQVMPDIAIFGWKDAQQFIILRRMVRDLDLPIEMVGGETVREPDGLAMSSRNQYISPAEREDALSINQSLKTAEKMIQGGILDSEKIAKMLWETISVKSDAIDYVEIVSLSDLNPISKIEHGNTLIAVAAHFGGARLIDNLRA